MGGTSDKFQFATDGNGNYGYVKKVSGADTFFPFSGAVKEFLFFANRPYTAGGYQLVGGFFIDGNSLTVIPQNTSKNDFLATQDLVSDYYMSNPGQFTFAKTGYYIINEDPTPTLYTAGQIFPSASPNTGTRLWYLGETNPFE